MASEILKVSRKGADLTFENVPASKIGPKTKAAVEAVENTLSGLIAGGPRFTVLLTEKFKKFGGKGEIVAPLGEKLEDGTYGIVLDADKAGLRDAVEDTARLHAGVIKAVAMAVASESPVASDEYADGFGWVPYASLLAVSDVLLMDAFVKAPTSKSPVPFADTYISAALKSTLSLKSVYDGSLTKAPVLRILVRTRSHNQEARVDLPVSVESLTSVAKASYAKAKEEFEAGEIEL